ncbi:hypothetical protein [Micromonospora arborensis]|uniref:hypothetical protein n=1 Tax=Micromonospora arborensis TaxID=2116518 RepID=UPI00371581B8
MSEDLGHDPPRLVADDRPPDSGARHQVTPNAVESLHRMIVAYHLTSGTVGNAYLPIDGGPKTAQNDFQYARALGGDSHVPAQLASGAGSGTARLSYGLGLEEDRG